MEISNVQRINRGKKTPPSSRRQKINVDKMERILSLTGGAFLTVWGVRENSFLGLLGALAGGALMFRGFTGYSYLNEWLGRGEGVEVAENFVININTSIKVNKPREELYAYWRNLENLPNFMRHLEKVEQIDDRRSRWTAGFAAGVGKVDWEAKIVREDENRYLSWESLPEADIDNAGEVSFHDAPNGDGTIVETTISYRPPAGDAGDYAAKLLNPGFEKMVRKDLKRFKKYMEKGGGPKRHSEPADVGE